MLGGKQPPAITQNENSVYVPKRTTSKSGRMSQRISQPRQNNSSRTGTSATEPKTRRATNIRLPLARLERRERVLP
jgi:hypothetical protein